MMITVTINSYNKNNNINGNNIKNNEDNNEKKIRIIIIDWTPGYYAVKNFKLRK